MRHVVVAVAWTAVARGADAPVWNPRAAAATSTGGPDGGRRGESAPSDTGTLQLKTGDLNGA